MSLHTSEKPLDSAEDGSAPSSPARHTRADIQGLRALAVLAVIANHLVAWPSGGFVGVDVFFVISGFLITGMILRDREDTGSISLGRFYARRAKRILPAALTVLAVTAVAAHFLFNTTRQLATLWDAGFAAVFLSNWRSSAIGTDYFHADTAASPLQHFWSLSIEEQFYLVWPGLLAIVLVVVVGQSKKRGAGRLAVGLVAAVLVGASFSFAMTQTALNPTGAYFSTLSRAWELGVGAIIAAAVPALARIPFPARFVAGWLGLIGIIASFVVIDDSVAFPGPWAALPVAASALVIIGGIGGRQRYLFPLENPVAVYLGDISYSLYLWHFPVITFMLILLPTQTIFTTAFVAAIILVISIVSYHLIEQPLHRTPDLRGLDADERMTAWQAWRERFSGQAMVSTIGVAVVALAVVLAAGNAVDGERPFASSDSPVLSSDAIQADLAAAVSATTWPTNLSPSLDSVMAASAVGNPAKGCFEVGGTPDFGACTWGNANAEHHMYLVGDSTALAYAPAFKAIAEASAGQWKITTIGLYGCRFTDVLVRNDGAGVMEACPVRKADVAARILEDKPDVVVVSNAFAAGQSADGGSIPIAGMVDSTIAEMAKYRVNQVVYLAPPPLGADLAQCYSPVSSPQSCTVPVDDAWKAFAERFEKSAVDGSVFLTSLPFSCADGLCPAFAGTLPTKYDAVHMTAEYSTHVAPVIRKELVDAGIKHLAD